MFLAVGRPAHQIKVHAVHAPILVGLMIVLTSQYGLVGAAWATVIAGFVVVPLSLVFVFRELGIRSSEFLAVVWRPATGAAVMYVIVTAIGRVSTPPGIAAMIMHLAMLVSIGALVYVLAVLCLWRSVGAPSTAERRVLGYVRDLLAAW